MAGAAAVARRVALVHNYYQQRGGEDVVFEAEMSMLRDRGCDVTVFTAHNDAIIGSGSVRLAARTVWNAKVHNQLLAFLRKQKPEVVHIHNTLPVLSPSVYYAAREAGAAIVQTLHNYRLTCANGLLFRSGHPCTECVGSMTQAPGVVHGCYRGSRLASAVVAGTVGFHRAIGTWRTKIDRFIATTQFAAETFIAAGISRERIAVKPHFLPDSEVPARESPRDAMGPSLFIGRLSEEKGIAVLLAAMRHLSPDRELAIIGDGPLRSEVMQAAAEDGRIHWFGHLSRHEVSTQIARASCVIVPSECYETFGRTVVEAFAQGVPVIASNHGALQSLVRHRANGLLFTPSDAFDLAARIEELTGDQRLNLQLGVAARRCFEERYTEEANYGALTQIYDAAIASNRATAA